MAAQVARTTTSILTVSVCMGEVTSSAFASRLERGLNVATPTLPSSDCAPTICCVKGRAARHGLLVYCMVRPENAVLEERLVMLPRHAILHDARSSPTSLQHCPRQLCL